MHNYKVLWFQLGLIAQFRPLDDILLIEFNSIVILLNGTLHSSLRVDQKRTLVGKYGYMNLIWTSFFA